MAAIIHGFQTNELKPQPGLQIRRTENGGWEASHEIFIKSDDFLTASASFAKGELLSGLDANIPEPFNNFLRIDTIGFSRVEGDLIVFNVTATGSGTGQFDQDGLGEDAIPTYFLNGQLVDAPFSQHRKWSVLSTADKNLLGMLISEKLIYNPDDQILYLANEIGAQVAYVDQLTDADAFEFAKRIAEGQTTYEKSVYTWTETTEGDDELTPQQLNALGLISVPRGDPPEPAGVRTWRLTSASQSQAGLLYRTNLEWTLSDEGGDDTFLYED